MIATDATCDRHLKMEKIRSLTLAHPDANRPVRQTVGFDPGKQGMYGQAPPQDEVITGTQEEAAGIGGGLTGLPGLGQGVPEQAMPQM